MSSRQDRVVVWLILSTILITGCAAVRIEEGSDVQLRCDVPFPRDYVLEWRRGDQVVLRYRSTSGTAVVTAAHFAGRVSLVGTRMDLGITSVQMTDSGDFYCSITNLATSDPPVTSARQTLTVFATTVLSTDDTINGQANREDCGRATEGVNLVTVILMTCGAGVGGLLAGVALGLLCRTRCRRTGSDGDSRVFHPAEVDF